MITDYQSTSCESSDMANVHIQEEPPKIPEIHVAFNNLRGKLNYVNKRLKSIVHILNGEEYDDKVAVKEAEILLSHQMGLFSNFEVLEKRIDEASEMIENIYGILGMEQGQFY